MAKQVDEIMTKTQFNNYYAFSCAKKFELKTNNPTYRNDPITIDDGVGLSENAEVFV